MRDVALRVAGKNDKAVRQLELTYGGGKTHTLITLRHLMTDPAGLPGLSAVAEFREAIGQEPPKARVACLCFDKLDVEKGMEVCDPKGTKRTLKQPWSVLAYQIAGDAGLRILNAENKAEERESAPAENLLIELLEIPVNEGLGVLVLIDEVLMYVREKVALDAKWNDRIINFFQYLTQAATKVDRCCIVASLLASDPLKTDVFGRKLQGELYDIFQRQREEAVEPVVKEDVAEVLRRRFFTPESIKDHDAFRPHVQAALKGLFDLDEQTRRQGADAEARFLRSFPVSPGPDRGVLRQMDPIGPLSADAGRAANLRAGAARSGKMGFQPLDRPLCVSPEIGERRIVRGHARAGNGRGHRSNTKASGRHGRELSRANWSGHAIFSAIPSGCVSVKWSRRSLRHFCIPCPSVRAPKPGI